MGSNKTFQQKHGRCVVLGESTEYRALRHAIEKAHGDRERAIRNVLPTLRREQALRAARCDPGGCLWHCSTQSVHLQRAEMCQFSAWPLNFVARFSTADNMAEAISLTFFAPTRNTWAPS